MEILIFIVTALSYVFEHGAGWVLITLSILGIHKYKSNLKKEVWTKKECETAIRVRRSVYRMKKAMEYATSNVYIGPPLHDPENPDLTSEQVMYSRIRENINDDRTHFLECISDAKAYLCVEICNELDKIWDVFHKWTVSAEMWTFRPGGGGRDSYIKWYDEMFDKDGVIEKSIRESELQICKVINEKYK